MSLWNDSKLKEMIIVIGKDSENAHKLILNEDDCVIKQWI